MGLAPPKKAPISPKLNMKHYKTVMFVQISECQSPKCWFGNMEMTSNCDVTNSTHQMQIVARPFQSQQSGVLTRM